MCFPGCGVIIILKALAKQHLKPCWNGAAHRYLYDPSINFILAMKYCIPQMLKKDNLSAVKRELLFVCGFFAFLPDAS